jgi:hypothetical protein
VNAVHKELEQDHWQRGADHRDDGAVNFGQLKFSQHHNGREKAQ